MSAPAKAAENHIHLPSVHIRMEHGYGFDYTEDFYIRKSVEPFRRHVERIVRLVIIENDAPTLIRETRDILCPSDLEQLEQDLPILMDEDNPEAIEAMEDCARREFARQLRIARGTEPACAKCGCSQSRACSGGCCWATESLCSRCV